MQLTIRHNFPEVRRRLATLREDVANLALARALNRTTEKARTDMSREIRAEFNLDAATVRDRLRVVRASYRDGRYEMTAALESTSKRGRSLNLIRFVERTVTMAAARKRMAAGEGGTYKFRGGVRTKQLELRFRIKRGGRAVVIPGAFIANEGRTVFIREGDSRLPIRALQTIDVPQMFNTKRINAKVVQRMLSDFAATFEREARYYTDRFNRS